MRETKIRLSFLFGLLATVLFGAGEAKSQTLNFIICNASPITAAVAVEHMISPYDQRFEVRGWYTIGPGQCQSVGYVPWGWVYFYAEEWGSYGRTYSWTGPGTTACVVYPGPFAYLNLGGVVCDPIALKAFRGEYLVGFSSWTWTLGW
jgi:uncharacterized membrane protein